MLHKSANFMRLRDCSAVSPRVHTKAKDIVTKIVMAMDQIRRALPAGNRIPWPSFLACPISYSPKARTWNLRLWRPGPMTRV